jgi:hypothetical protein
VNIHPLALKSDMEIVSGRRKLVGSCLNAFWGYLLLVGGKARTKIRSPRFAGILTLPCKAQVHMNLHFRKGWQTNSRILETFYTQLPSHTAHQNFKMKNCSKALCVPSCHHRDNAGLAHSHPEVQTPDSSCGGSTFVGKWHQELVGGGGPRCSIEKRGG